MKAIDYQHQDFAVEIKAHTGGKGVDLTLDPVGAAYLRRNLEVLAPGGRLVNIGLMGGSRAEIDLGLVLGKNLRLIGFCSLCHLLSAVQYRRVTTPDTRGDKRLAHSGQ